MKKVVTITVDGQRIEAQEESPLLAALLREGWDIPTLCYHEAVTSYGACRLCLVEVNQKGWKPEWRKLTTSCNFPVLDGLTVYTDSEKVLRHRKLVIELILTRAPGAKVVRDIAGRLGVEATRHRDQEDELCILCGLCTRVCDQVIGAHALTFHGRGTTKDMGTAYAEASDKCIGCASCANICPTGAISVVESKGRRTIWYREFEMVRCTECGKSYITVEQMRYHVKRTSLDERYFELCDECSRSKVARRMLEHVL